MKIHLTYWIYIFGFLLELQFAASNTTVTDSSLLNLIVENLTETNLNKQLKTSGHSLNDSFSSNSVNTGPLYSHQIIEECKNNDCSRDVLSTQSTDNLSTTSKILWSLVSTVRSTNEHSANDKLNTNEGTTVSPVNNVINIHYHDHSVVNNSSSNSDDNELDADINLQYDMHHTSYSSEGINNSSSGFPFIDLNYTVTTSQSVTRVSENKFTKLYRFEENSTSDWEPTETYPEMSTSDSYLVTILNMSENADVPVISETNLNDTDEELNLAYHFLNSSSTNETEFVNVVNDTQVTENLTTEIFYSEIDSLNYEYNESSTLFSVNNDMMAESSTSLTTENENETLLYRNYDISLEAEELESKDNLSIITTDIDQNAQFTHSTPTSVFETLLDGNLWLMNDDAFNIANLTISNTGSSIDTELPISEPVITSSTKYDFFSKENFLLNGTSDNTSSVPTMTANFSTDMSEVTDSFSYLSQETQMSTSHTGIYIQNISDVSSEDSVNILWNDPTLNSSLESTEMTYFTIPENGQKSNEIRPIVQDTSTIIPSNITDSTENLLGTSNTAYDLPLLEIIKQNTTVFLSTLEHRYSDEGNFPSASNEESFSTEKLNTDNNTSVVSLNNVQASSTQSMTDLDRSSPTQTTLVSGFFSEETENLSTTFSVTSQSPFTIYPLKDNSHNDEGNITIPVHDKIPHFTTSYETEVITSSKIPNDILSSTEHLDNESSTFNNNNYTVFISSEMEGDNDLIAGKSNKPINYTGYTPMETVNENTDNVKLDEETKIVSHPSSEPVHGLFDPSISTDNITPSSSENINSSDEIIHSSRLHSDHSESVTESIYSKKEMMQENTFSPTSASSINELVTNHKTNTTVTEVNTSPTSAEVSSIEISETHREGKHIPFSTTLARSTTEYPRILNITVKNFSHEPETTENNFVNMLYTQIKADELSPEERSNLINAIVKLPDTFYSKEILNEKIAIIHLWLLHAIANEYKNSTINLPESKDGPVDEIEFENLPQILYVLPSPEISLPNISFTFIVQNKWRNETFPVDIILTILNLHIEDLKHLVEIEDIHFSRGLLVQKHDLLSVIIEKYGIILLSTCLITVAMIFLLICVVIYYRRKTRHSAHCLTDDKLHRNMQEAMGIDLNPAVVILQEEIREKAALNGNKICNLNDDEGWLAPIGDVPVEDNNAPFVQDTKL